MGIPFKTEIGLVYIAMAINCKEIAAKLADDGDWYEYVKCVAKAVKPECASCSLLNPISLSSDPPNSHEHGC